MQSFPSETEACCVCVTLAHHEDDAPLLHQVLEDAVRLNICSLLCQSRTRPTSRRPDMSPPVGPKSTCSYAVTVGGPGGQRLATLGPLN